MFVTKCCNKNYQHKFDEKLNDRFLIHTIFLTTAFILLLQKGVFPYEYMDDWETFYKTLSKKEHFYSHLNMEDITDADYTHIKK